MTVEGDGVKANESATAEAKRRDVHETNPSGSASAMTECLLEFDREEKAIRK